MRYEAATFIASGPAPGALALEAYALALGHGSAGIFNPRNVRGSVSTLSLHAEGRAVDITPGDAGADALTGLVDLLVWHHQALGVQQVIWHRRSWRVGRAWEPYGGTDPHTSHAHVELTRAAADGLTVETIEAVIGTEGAELNTEERAMFDEIHAALVGLRKMGGDPTRVHDLATPILNANHYAAIELPRMLAELAAAMPRALDLELLADAIVRRLPHDTGLNGVDPAALRTAVVEALTAHPLRPTL
jgi:hypothetical protein